MSTEHLRAACPVMCIVLTMVLALRVSAQDLQSRNWTVDGQDRTALLYAPTSAVKAANAKAVPIVFVFHGHGGNARQAALSFHIHQLWPEALCIYPQGLNTPGKLTDPEGKRSGWQHSAGDQQDRDLKFFDAMLSSISQEYAIDPQQVFSTGHSNGGGFTYLLWAERGDKIRAVAPSAAVGRVLAESKSKPKPVLHLAGENDELVKYAWKQSTLGELKRFNGCSSTGVDWDKNCTLYRSQQNAPLVAFVHAGAHKFPDEGPQLIVKFFKQVIDDQSPIWSKGEQ